MMIFCQNFFLLPIVISRPFRNGCSSQSACSVTLRARKIKSSRKDFFFRGNGHRAKFSFYFSDPDLKRNDGIYSRYLTDFPGGEGRYTVKLVVDDNNSKAKSYQWAGGK